jgi:peptidoglycan lytic transglycosylase D
VEPPGRAEDSTPEPDRAGPFRPTLRSRRIDLAPGRLHTGAGLTVAACLTAVACAHGGAESAAVVGAAPAPPSLASRLVAEADPPPRADPGAAAAEDALAEQPTEPAAIDDLGDLAGPANSAPEEILRVSPGAARGEAGDFPVALNDAVASCIELYRGPRHDWFAAALARGAPYLPRIREIFAAEGVPRDLAYLGLVESAFKPRALSRARARGVWQFIPETGRRFGLKQDWWVDERSHPDKATRAAARYLRQLHAMFGDWNLALAAYNAGEQRVRRAVQRRGTRDFWKLARTRALLPETRRYVPLIHAAILVAKAPERYGFDHVVPEPERPFEHVPVEGAVDLRVIAECAETTLDEVRFLNPDLRRLATPADGSFDVRVPRGAGPDVLECLGALPASERARFRSHVVARGETLSGIAAAFGVSAAEVAAANRITRPRRLRVGTRLIIPVRVASGAGASTAPRAGGEAADGASGARR